MTATGLRRQRMHALQNLTLGVLQLKLVRPGYQVSA